MNQITPRILIAILCFALINQAASTPESDQKLNYGMARFHDSDTMFFEQIEDGVVGQFIAFKFYAGAENDGSKWAQCTYAVIYIDKEKKRSELNLVHASTDDNTIKNLSVSPKSVSFDINIGWFEQGGNSRLIHFMASRQGMYSYQGSAIALWKNMFDETKHIKIEWKQVPSIALPFPLMGP